jgi:class 3 adenylate cyclase
VTQILLSFTGFTAWSSTREPSSVFTLLEAIYAEFDSIAKRRRVFKVEVVGDCYVAVAGLPDPRPDHAIVMAKFANDCLNRMFSTLRKLEVELGPDTTELGLRVGLHSGPVVAGVLRGDKSRFQLFGDTVSVVISVLIVSQSLLLIVLISVLHCR